MHFHSVLMVDVAALALAASILKRIGHELSDPLDWRITPFTQHVKTFLPGSSSSLHRIR
jgi:hypothetical protein